MKKIILLVSMVTGFAVIGSSQVKVTKESPQREIKQPPTSKETSNPEIKPKVNPEIKPSVKPEIKPESKPQTVVKPVAKPNPEARPAQISKPVPETIKPMPEKDNGPSLEQRKHAEEKSNGNAFSGKGKGGDKNLVDPAKKGKKNNKGNKKNK